MLLILLVSLIFGCAQADVTALNETAKIVDPVYQGEGDDELLQEYDRRAENEPEYLTDLMGGDWSEDVIGNTTDEELPWDMDSLVSLMTKGDAKLTAFIIKKIGELRRKTWKQHDVINAKLKRLLGIKNTKAAGARKASKVYDVASAAYKQAVKDAAYDYAQVSQECQSYDRIMAQLNAMKDWKKCPGGWTQVGRSCYKVLSRARAYLQEYRCLKQGASLVRVDNADDRKALTKLCSRYKKGYTDTHCQVGFFRRLLDGNWMYINSQAVNPASWYRWGNNYNHRAYNYVGWYGPNKHNYALAQNGQWGALCEHRLAVNLLK